MFNCKQTGIKCIRAQNMIFSLSPNRNNNDKDIKINEKVVAHATCTEFLGVLIDEVQKF